MPVPPFSHVFRYYGAGWGGRVKVLGVVIMLFKSFYAYVMYGSVGVGVRAVAGIMMPWSLGAKDAVPSSKRMARNT